MHVAQSAISEQIRDLEAEIGVSLFDRSQRSIRLTGEGEIFVEGAREVLRAAEDAVEQVRRSSRGETGKLTIGFFVGGTGDFFPGLIRSFRRRYKDVKVSLVEMTPQAQVTALQAGTIDIGFTRPFPPSMGPSLRSERFITERLLAVLPREHRLAREREIAIADLSAEQFVVTERRSSLVVFDKTLALCAEAGFSPQISATATVSSGMLALVEAGEGIAILPEGVQTLGAKGLAFRPISGPNATVDLIVAWSAENERAVHHSFLQLARSFRDGAKPSSSRGSNGAAPAAAAEGKS